MTAGTAAVLDAALAVEREADAALRQSMFHNPAAVAWAEDRFDDGLSPDGDGLYRPHPRPMVQLRDDRCDCWRGLEDLDECLVGIGLHAEDLRYHLVTNGTPSIPSEYARWVAGWYVQAHRTGARGARRARQRTLFERMAAR